MKNGESDYKCGELTIPKENKLIGMGTFDIYRKTSFHKQLK